MPIYVYQVIHDDGSAGEVFEIHQSMNDPPLACHPDTGEPVRRVYLAPNLSMKWTPGQEKKVSDNKYVESRGFTKYERDKLTGRYHKVAGKNKNVPDTLQP